MEVITVSEELRDGVAIFEVTYLEEFVMCADKKTIAEYVDINEDQVKDGKKTKGYKIKLVGYTAHLYKYAGHTGTRDELQEKLNIVGRASAIVKKHMRIENSLHVDGEPAHITQIVDFYKRQEKKEAQAPKIVETVKRIAPKIKYKGENKAYIDYLFDTTFKGWRA